MNIHIVRNHGELNQEQWRFYYYDSRRTLYLDWYGIATRKTKRHKFQIESSYSRLDNRGHSIQEAQVPIPDDVRAEAIQEFIQGIQVKTWSEE